MRETKKLLKGIKQGFHSFGDNITALVNSILLSIVYFIAVGPTSILAKLLNKKFLETKLNKHSKTYWQDLNLTKKPMEEYYRQF